MPRRTIGKTFKFDAAHLLGHLPETHKCSRLHGHTYYVTLTLITYEVDLELGWVVDYGEMKPFKDFIDYRLDHRNLNDIMSSYTTAEKLAEWLYSIAKRTLELPNHVRVYSVRVQETQDTFAEYSEG